MNERTELRQLLAQANFQHREQAFMMLQYCPSTALRYLRLVGASSPQMAASNMNCT
ncbi:MAG: hypothetical protein PUP92_00930 [Rhizonema sp. PD38]|nr:hypothetical protein [Rhizonema sp. PD38]